MTYHDYPSPARILYAVWIGLVILGAIWALGGF